MADQLKAQISKLKAEIANWPKDQKGSFVEGISEGLLVGVLAAGDGARGLAQNPDINELLDFLDRNRIPVKRAKQSRPEPKPAKDQLRDDMKELLRRAIACRLRIPKDHFDTSLDVEEEVNKLLQVVIAVANRKALDDAIQDIQNIRSVAGGGALDRETIKSEVEAAYEMFSQEIAVVELFNDFSKRGVHKPKDVWIALRSHTTLDFGYEDEALQRIDQQY